MSLDQKIKFTAESQVGFTKTPGGAIRHGVTINELIHDTSRERKNLYLTTIDFEDAFGSIPHDVIERNLMEDPKAVLIAIKLVCEHELLDNPYVRNVTLFKSKPKEL
jgi:hypothetical protein